MRSGTAGSDMVGPILPVVSNRKTGRRPERSVSVQAMGFMDSIRGEFIDIVEFLDDSRDTIVWRFPRHDNEIKNGAQLVVREGQTAVFVNEGQIADVFGP